MHGLTYTETTTADALNNSVGGRLITLFQQQNLNRSQKIDSAYKIIRESAPALPTREYVLHSRILIQAAEQAIMNAKDTDTMTDSNSDTTNHDNHEMPLGANQDGSYTGPQFFTAPPPLHPLDALNLRARNLLNRANDMLREIKGGANENNCNSAHRRTNNR